LINNLQDKVQREAVQAWIDIGKIGCLNLSTGTGKSIAALHCLYTMPKFDVDGKTHLFLAETVQREKDILDDIEKYNKIFGVNIQQDYFLKFSTYQSAYKYENKEYGLVIADEAHFSLTEQYSKFYYNNKYDALVALTATTERDVEYIIDGKKITKGDLLDEIAPVCYTYTLAQSKEDGIGRILNIYVVKSELDSINKTIKAGSKTKPFFQTEKSAYDYWDREHKKSWFIEDKEVKDFKIRITSTKRSALLYNLPSKINIVKQILDTIKGKTIIFSNSLDSLLKITPNTVSSRYSEDRNKEIREAFDSDKISIIGSFKKLLQGANLKKLDNCILMSYFSSEGQVIQKLGRIRKYDDKVGNVFILLTNQTQEEIWFSKMIQDLTEFNFIYCNNIEDCIKLYKENEGNS